MPIQKKIATDESFIVSKVSKQCEQKYWETANVGGCFVPRTENGLRFPAKEGVFFGYQCRKWPMNVEI